MVLVCAISSTIRQIFHFTQEQTVTVHITIPIILLVKNSKCPKYNTQLAFLNKSIQIKHHGERGEGGEVLGTTSRIL